MPFTPTQLAQQGAAFDKISVAESDRSVLTAPLVIGRNPVTVLLKGHLTTDGISFIDGQWGPKHSFGLRLDSEEDERVLDELLQGLDDVDGEADFGEWTTRHPFKNGVLYLKCPVDRTGKQFGFTSNLKLAPNKPNPALMQNVPVEAHVTVSAYFATDEANRGISFKLRHAEFPPETSSAPAADEETPDRSPVQVQTPPAPKKQKQVSQLLWRCRRCGVVGNDGAAYKHQRTCGPGCMDLID